MHHPTDRIAHTTACYTILGALAGMRNSSMGPPHDSSNEALEYIIIFNEFALCPNQHEFLDCVMTMDDCTTRVQSKQTYIGELFKV